MANWLKCTSADKAASVVFVNMDLIISILPRDTGGRLFHGSGNAAFIDVAETPEEIMQAAGEARSDARGNR